MSCTSTGEKKVSIPKAEKVYLYFTYSTIQEQSDIRTNLTAKIQRESATDTIIDFTTSGDATRDEDYELLGSRIIIKAGDKTGSIEFNTINDGIYEGNEDVDVTISSVSGSSTYTYAGPNGKAKTIIYDDENPSSVSLTASDLTVMEDSGFVTVYATLDSVVSEDVEVMVSAEGSAISGEDYNIPNGGKIIIPAGSLTAGINVGIINDVFYNESLSLSLRIIGVSGGGAMYTEDSGVDVIISNEDTAPKINISADSYSVSEGGNIMISAQTEYVSDEDIVVQLTTSGDDQVGVGFNLSNNGEITIPAGSLTAGIVMSIIEDGIYELTKNVTIGIGSVNGGGAMEYGSQEINVALLDNENFPLISFYTDSSIKDEASGQIFVKVSTATPSYQDIEVQLATSGGAQEGVDYSASNNKKIIIPAGGTIGTLMVSIINDNVYEVSTEKLILDIETIVGGNEDGDQKVEITITDDDNVPTIEFETASSTRAESVGQVNIVAKTHTVSSEDIVIQLTTSGSATYGDDYSIADDKKITINAGSTSGSVVLSIVNDSVYEGGDEKIILDMETVSGGNEVGTQNIEITIIDDESEPSVSLSTMTSQISESDSSIVVQAEIDTLSSVNTEIFLSFGGTATPGSDFDASNNKIIINAGNLTGSLSIPIINDGEEEGATNETLTVSIGTVLGAQENGEQQSQVEIQDDDIPFISLSASRLEMNESGNVATEKIDLIATSNMIYHTDVVISLGTSGSATDIADYSISNNKVITIPAGQLTGQIELTPNDDLMYEGDENVKIDIDSVSGGLSSENGVQSVDIVITENEVAPTVSIASSANNIYENGSNISITATSTGAVVNDMVLAITATGTALNGSDYAEITSITIPAGQLTGVLSFNPVDDQLDEGSETVKMIISQVSGISGISILEANEVNIEIKEYSMRQGTSFVEGTQALQDQIKNEPRFLTSQSPSMGPVKSMEQMNIHRANSFSLDGQALDGTGQKIHFIDSACDVDHDLYTGRNVFNLDDGGQGEGVFTDSTVGEWHCNHVVGLAVGNTQDIRGVAMNADIIISNMDRDQGDTLMQSHLDDVASATDLGAVASNNSWGFKDPDPDNPNDNKTYLEIVSRAGVMGISPRQYMGIMYGIGSGTTAEGDAAMDNYVNIYKAFQDQGGVVVFSSGNHQGEDVSVLGAMPEIVPELKGAWLSVSNVNFTGSSMATATEADFGLIGNKCGTAAEYCLSVDGNSLNSAKWVDDSQPAGEGSQNGHASGSSMSAPLVSGGIALLSQAFPNHNSKQITDRLLASANNTWFTPDGEVVFSENGNGVKHGYSSMWGHGTPDFYAALSPITTDSNATTSVFVGNSVGDTNNSYSYDESVISTTATFGDSLKSSLVDEVGYTYDALNGGFKYDISRKVNLSDGNSDSISVDTELNAVDDFSQVSKLGWRENFAQVVLSDDDFGLSNKLTVGSSSLPIQSFYGSNMDEAANLTDLDTPYLKNSEGGIGFGSVYSAGNTRVLFGMTTPVDVSRDGDNTQLGNKNTIAASIEYNADSDTALTLITGLSVEKDSLLGSTGKAAFNMDGSESETKFAAIKAQAKFDGDFVLTGIATLSDTNMTSPGLSLLNGARGISSSSLGVMMRKSNLTEDDELSMFLRQPNRVDGGSLSMRVAGLADENGDLSYENRDYSLSTSGRQLDYGISYKKRVSNDLSLSIRHQISKDRNHIAGADTDNASFVGFKYRDFGFGMMADSNGDSERLLKYNYNF